MNENVHPGKEVPDTKGSEAEGVTEVIHQNNQSKKSSSLYGKKRVIFPLIIFVLIVAGTYWYWDTYLRGYISTDDAHIDGNSVIISSKILGRIEQLKIDEGDTVKTGQLLVYLDTADLNTQKAQAEANLEFAKKNSALAMVSLSLAKEDFNRAALQYENKIIPQEQYDHARQAVDKAQAQYEVALAQINTAKSQIDIFQTQLQNTRIVSPFDGVVAKKWVMPGDVVQPTQPIYTIYDLHKIWVEANFDEKDLSLIHLGDAVEISVDSYPGLKFEGKVYLIGAAAASEFSLIPPNNASGNYTKVSQRVPFKISIKADAAGGDDPIFLLPGMSVVVKVRVRGERK